jgi:hypothetical protein
MEIVNILLEIPNITTCKEQELCCIHRAIAGYGKFRRRQVAPLLIQHLGASSRRAKRDL